MFKVIKVKLNYMNEVAGLVRAPSISWQMVSDERNSCQSAYEIQVSLDKMFSCILYDSGMVLSGASAGILLALELRTAQRYFVRIKAQNMKGVWSTWSAPVTFLSGVIDNAWQAKFISAETEKDADNSKGTYIRREISLEKEVESASVYATAFGLYHFFINGQRIGTDEMTPGWTSYHKHLMYQTYDVTSLLKKGANVLGAHLGAGWYKGLMSFNHIRNIYGKQTAFLAELHVKYQDGSENVFSTDDNWRGTDSPVIFSEIYDGEIYDARLEQPGWNHLGFNDKEWHSVQIISGDTSILSPQYASKAGINDCLKPKRIFQTPKGETVVDFGQNMTGWIKFSVNGKAGDRVILKCFEVLDREGNAYFANLRAAKEQIDYTCHGGDTEIYHPNFTYQGFQYAQIVSWPGTPRMENFVACTVHSVMEQTGFFECSNSDINQLQHNILWGLKGNFLDVPTDCPQRDERLGWTGDAQIFSRTACYLMNTYAFYEKWLQDVAADQTPEGGVPHVVPDVLTGYSEKDTFMNQGTDSATAWADAAVVLPWSMYLTFGDTGIIHQQYDSMKKWIDFMHSHADDKGIWHYKLQFGDWVALDAEPGSYFGATPNELVCSAYYAYSTGLFAKMAKAIGREIDAAVYETRYRQIVQHYRNNFFDAKGNLIAQTQTAHVISLYFNLVADKYRAKIAKRLVELIRKEGGHLVTGFVGTPYICHALSQNGYIKEAWELLLKEDFPSWLYQVKHGATTIWEHWDGLKPDGTMWSADMNSFNHYAYGAIGEWLYRAAAGLEIDESHPGYQNILFQPLFGEGISYVKASYESVYGKVEIHWQINENTGCVKIIVPVNTTAQLRLDNVSEIIEPDGLTFSLLKNGYETKTGSGEYVVKFKVVN